MVRGQQKKASGYLSHTEIESLNEEKGELLAALKEVESGAGAGTQGAGIDTGKIKQEIARIDEVIHQRSVPKNLNKDSLVREEKELEAKIADGMPTQYEMRKPTLNPGAVKKHIQWNARNAGNIARYVEIQRILRPDEPKSIENLRREK